MKKELIASWVMSGMVFVSLGQTTIIDAGFSIGDSPSYLNGDLVGQNNWTAMPNTGFNAFNIIEAAGAGYADTRSASDSFDGVNGNHVYFNPAMSNNVDDVWSGTCDFQLSTVPAEGSTNATIVTAEVLTLGLSSSTTNGLSVDDDNDIVIATKVRNTSGIVVLFQSGGVNVRVLADLSADELGWNPNGTQSVQTNRFETDPFSLDWSIRKIRSSTDEYEVTTVLSNKTTGFVNTRGGVTYGCGGIHAADDVYFAMGHSWESAGPTGTNTLVDLSMDALSVERAENQLPAIETPADLTAVPEDQQIDLSWDGVAEADSYNVKRGTEWGGTYSILTNVTNAALIDTGLVNGQSYYYMVSALFADGSNPDVESSDSSAMGAVPSSAAFQSVLMDFRADGTEASSTVLTLDQLIGTVVVASSTTGAPLIDPIKNAVTDTAGLSGVIKFNVMALDDDGNNSPTPFVPSTWTGGVQSAGNRIALNRAGWGVWCDAKSNDYLQNAETLVFTVDLSELILGEGQNVVLNGITFYEGDVSKPRSGDIWMRDFDVPEGTAGAGVQLADNVVDYAAGDLILSDGDMFAFMRGVLDTRLTGIELDIRGGDASPATGYESWIGSYGPVGPDAEGTLDLDDDGFNNLWEYGTGGDPIDPENTGTAPVLNGLVADGGTNYIEYVHLNRTAANSGMDAHLETTPDLVVPAWTNGGYVVSGRAPVDADFEIVTNRVFTEEAALFVKFVIEEE